MKKLFILLIFIISAVSLYADGTNPPFPLTKGGTTLGNTGGSGTGSGSGIGNEDNDDDKGQRAPARPVFCSIDFDAAEVNITGYDSAEIESYEICDAESHACIFATNDCAEFVAELANINHTVYVIFYFDDCTLCGYFTR